MTGHDAVVRWLEEAEVPFDTARVVADYVQVIDDPTGPEAEALIVRKRRGQDAKIESIKPGNIVLDWERLVVDGGPRLVGLGPAGLAFIAGSPPLGIAVAAFTALAALFRVSQVALSTDQQKVVEALYLGHKGEPEVPVEALRRDFAGVLDEPRLEQVLDQLVDLSIIEIVAYRVLKRERFISAS
jgi:hypothetical protein